MLRGAVVLASIMEDLPYPENRVTVDGGEVAMHYEIYPNDKSRLGLFRKKIADALRPYRFSHDQNGRAQPRAGSCVRNVSFR